MKQFNQTIIVAVSVDTIAQELLDKFREGYAHAELITELTIENALKTNTIGSLWANLNGQVSGINFEVGGIYKVVIDDYSDSDIQKTKICILNQIDYNEKKVNVTIIDRFGSVTRLDDINMSYISNANEHDLQLEDARRLLEQFRSSNKATKFVRQVVDKDELM